MSQLKLSVCIPTYNGAAYLTPAIQSVLDQSFDGFELLVVDDASTDNTAAMVQSFDDPRLTLHQNSTRLGLVGNWNRCLELAQGEYINIFHHDDIMLPDNLARKVAFLDENPAVGWVYSEVRIITETGAVRDPSWFYSTEAQGDVIFWGYEFFKKLLLGFNYISCPSVMARRPCYEQVGPFDPRLPFTVDWEMWMRLALHYPVGYLVEPLLHFRVHERSTSNPYHGLTELEHFYAAKAIILEKCTALIPNHESLKAQVLAHTEAQASALAWHHLLKDYAFLKAWNALQYALTIHHERQTCEAKPWDNPPSVHIIAETVPAQVLLLAIVYKFIKRLRFGWRHNSKN